MGNLHLHDILYPNNLLRQLVNGDSSLVICRKMLSHNRKVNDLFLKSYISIYNSCQCQK